MLDILNLEVVYHSVVRVLHGVSLSVGDGEIVALLGRNGAGKTTTLRAVTGLFPLHEGRITKGQVRLQGASIAAQSAERIVCGGVAQSC